MCAEDKFDFFFGEERIIQTSILVCVILLLSTSGHTACPTADLTGDCYVDLADLAVLANEWAGQTSMPLLYDMARQWVAEKRGPQGMVFVSIPGGTFQMGDNFNEGETDERPVHTVTIGTFKMSKYEVTNAQYAEYLNAANTDGLIKVSGDVVYAASDSSNSQPYFDTHNYDSDSQIDYVGGTFTVLSKSGHDMSNDPVGEISWYGTKAFCEYYGYRLPTEAEWEYAARGGQHNPYYRFPWGDTISHSHANYWSSSSYSYDVSPTEGYHPSYNDGIYPYTSPVETFTANGYGLHDMSGNVWEWCNDWYDSGYYNGSPQPDPQGPVSGSYRVIRGGCWYATAYYCRSAVRYRSIPGYRGGDCGFRPCLDSQ